MDNAKPIAPAQWNYMDQQSPYLRIMRTATGLEGVAVGVRIAALNAPDPETLRTILSGAAELIDQSAAVLVAQGSRMEDCPYCAHATQPLEVKEVGG